MRAKFLHPILALWLGGCTAAGSCELLALKSYDRATEQRLLTELERAPPAATWPNLITDYVALRDEVRACKGNADAK